MLLLRIVAPVDLAAQVVGYLESLDVACDLVHIPGAGRKPKGDLIQCLVPAETGSAVVGVLRELGVAIHGSIIIDRVEAAVSDAAARADALEPDSLAVIWEEVEARTRTMAEASPAFLIYMMAATVIAAIGVLTDSTILIVGAMVLGPEFGPLAGLCVGLVQRRRALIRTSAVALVIGFALAIVAALVATLLFRAAGMGPVALDSSLNEATMFIARPDGFSVVVASLAGAAGMLSLTTASAGTLVGILISVTTLPAAANIGVGLAYRDIGEVEGSAAQLGINVAAMLIAGGATLLAQRLAFTRQLAGYLARLNPPSQTRSTKDDRG